MVHRPRILQLTWLAAGVGLLAAAGALERPLRQASLDYELALPPTGEASAEIELLRIMPGGLRAPMVNYLWIRAQSLKNQGRYYDAKQLADLICMLQPRFESVWGFHAWNMAWNISVATQTSEERWMWIMNGVKLLRDRGIPANPKSVMLYNDLAWIFFSKMGGNTDDKHMEFKQRWADEMQRLLGAPPGGLVVSTADAIEAFEAIAGAPLDKAADRQGKERIQADQLALLMTDPAVAAYADELAKYGLAIDERFLGLYNALGNDSAVAIVRALPLDAAGQAEGPLAAAINAPAHAEARSRILAFLRAQLLWNVYKMDPQYMLKLMVRHEAPLDWRLVWSHAIYWASLGIERADIIGDPSVPALNIDRIVLGAFRLLTAFGRMSYVDNPQDPNFPTIKLAADWRFIEPAHREYLRLIEPLLASGGTDFFKNQLGTGHINFLQDAIQMLVALRRIDEANRYYRFLKDDYGLTGGNYDEVTAEGFALAQIRQESSERRFGSQYARMQITVSLEVAFVHLSQGDADGFGKSFQYAYSVYRYYQKDAPERLAMEPFEDLAGPILARLLVRPRAAGYNIPLSDRARLYAALGRRWPRMQLVVYDLVAPSLQIQARAQGLDFNKAFPMPRGLVAYRAQMRRRQKGLGQGQPTPASGR